MPFFAQQKWMGAAGRIWLWIALTLPSTIVAFVIYVAITRKQGRDAPCAVKGDVEAGRELSSLDSDEEV